MQTHLVSVVALLALVSILQIQSVLGIKCWVCRSDQDNKCGDPFDNSSIPLTNCDNERPLVALPGAQATMCRKIRQTVDGELYIHRSCGWVGEPEMKIDPEDEAGVEVLDYDEKTEAEHYFCTTDGCNSAPVTTLGPLAILLPLVGAIML